MAKPGWARSSFFRARLPLALCIAAILWVTLLPASGQPNPLSWTCIVCGHRGLADVLLNLGLFLPLGAALQLNGGSARRTAALGAALSLGIELLQTLIPGRDPAVGDFVFNVLGTTVGFAIAAVRGWWLRPSPTVALRLTLTALAGAIGVFNFTGYVLRPSLPLTEYYGQWTPELGHLDWYRGEVILATLGPLPMPSHRLADSDSVRSLLARGAPLHVLAVAGPPTERLASLFSIFDHRRFEIVLVGPDGYDLVYRYRTRAAELRLDQPDLRRVDLLDELAAGDTFSVSVTQEARGACIALNGDSVCKSFTLGVGWGLLLYLEGVPAWLRVMLNVVWMALLAAAIGFWSRGRWPTAGVIVGFFAVLAFLPGIWQLGPTPPSELAGAGLGIAAGLGLRWCVQVRQGQ